MEARTLLRPTTGPHSRGGVGSSCNGGNTGGMGSSLSPRKLVIPSSNGSLSTGGLKSGYQPVGRNSTNTYREKTPPSGRILPSTLKANNKGKMGGFKKPGVGGDKKEYTGKVYSKTEKQELLKKLLHR